MLVRAGFMHIKCAITFFMTHMLQTEYRIIHYFHWTNLRSRNLIPLNLLKGQGRKEIANIKEEPKRSTIAVVSYSRSSSNQWHRCYPSSLAKSSRIDQPSMCLLSDVRFSSLRCCYVVVSVCTTFPREITATYIKTFL